MPLAAQEINDLAEALVEPRSIESIIVSPGLRFKMAPGSRPICQFA